MYSQPKAPTTRPDDELFPCSSECFRRGRKRKSGRRNFSQPAPKESIMNPSNKAVLEQFNQAMGQFWQSGDSNLFDQVIAEDCAFHQPDIPPTGKRVQIKVMDVIRLEEGRFTEHWGIVDQVGLMQQLGVIP
ncbi:ester cyclase [Meiothermus sp.]|uniref:ester cyclase n=1 Tax=Meiothermus sp. TaxID=1955249 RepID=UPI00307F3E93